MNRFLIAQNNVTFSGETVLERAIREISNGYLSIHCWIRYLFPQMKGLGKTLRDSTRAIDVNTKAQQENTEQMETTKGSISVGSDGYLVKSAGYVSSSTSNNSVSNHNSSSSKASNSVKIEKSSEEERKEDQDRKVNEMSFKELVKQNENLESLRTMMMFNNPAAMAYGVGSKLFGAIRNS